MGMSAILVMWPGPFEQSFIPHPKEAPEEIWLNQPSGFRGEDVENVDSYTHGRQSTVPARWNLESCNGKLTG